MEDPRSPASAQPPSPATTVIGDDPSQLVGAVIGPYKLIEQNWRRRIWAGLCCRAAQAGQTPRGPQSHQAGDGHP
jgi:hypothetical protein